MTQTLPAVVEQQTQLWPVEGEPDACDVAVSQGPVTFVFKVTRLFLQRRKLESHVGVDWLPTVEGSPRGQFDYMPPVGFSPVNLDWRSNSSLETYRRQLQQYFDPKKELFEWPRILQLASQRVNEFVTSPGDFEFADHVAVVEPGYLCKPILPARGVTIWFGQGEAGKGYMACGIVTALLYQKRFAGLTTSTAIRHVYYVDYEEPDKEEFDVRMSRVANGMEAFAAPVQRYNPRGRLLVDIADALKVKIAKDGGNPDNALLIIDSALPAVGGQAIDPEPVGAFFGALHYIGLPVLLIAHDTKVGNEDSPFGSIFWRNLARMCVNFQTNEEPYKDVEGHVVRDILLRCQKANNVRRFPPLAFQLIFTDDEAAAYSPQMALAAEVQGAPPARPLASTWIRQIDPTTVSPELTSKLPLLRRLTAIFKDAQGEELTVKDLVETTGVPRTVLYKVLARNPSVFESDGGGRGRGKEAGWRLIQGGKT